MNNSNKSYIQKLYTQDNQLPIVEEMERYASEHKVPIIEPDGVELLKQLVRIHRPKRILEVGTAIGYSAIQMAFSNDETVITSIELDQTRYEEATNFVKKAKLTNRIELILGDASDVLDETIQQHQYDFVFIDAAKGQYRNYIEKITPYLQSGSLVIIDNVLFKGYVSKVQDDHKRLMKLGEKIDRFNQWLIEHPEYDTTIVETGDGVAIALKR